MTFVNPSLIILSTVLTLFSCTTLDSSLHTPNYRSQRRIPAWVSQDPKLPFAVGKQRASYSLKLGLAEAHRLARKKFKLNTATEDVDIYWERYRIRTHIGDENRFNVSVLLRALTSALDDPK